MKHYLAVVQNEGTAALYTYDTLDAALVAYHNELAYRSEDRTSTKCAIMNSDLVVVMSESYFAPQEA